MPIHVPSRHATVIVQMAWSRKFLFELFFVLFLRKNCLFDFIEIDSETPAAVAIS